jgi:hypothetical protein
MQIGIFNFEILNLTFEGKNVKYFLKNTFSYTQLPAAKQLLFIYRVKNISLYNQNSIGKNKNRLPTD